MTLTPERTHTDTDDPVNMEAAIVELLLERLAGRDLTTLGSADDIVDRMVSTLPDSGQELAQAVGPVFHSGSLQTWLGISRQALNQHVQARRILRLITADGVSVYPGFQFDNDGERLPHIKDILDVLAEGSDDPWTWALWLTSVDDTGTTNAEYLRTGHWQMVLNEAQEDSASWSRP